MSQNFLDILYTVRQKFRQKTMQYGMFWFQLFIKTPKYVVYNFGSISRQADSTFVDKYNFTWTTKMRLILP